MISIFCPNCGSKHTYNYSKPKFCSSCGNAMAAMLEKPKAVSKARLSSNDDDYDDDDSDPENSSAEHVPQINKFQFEIEHESEYNSFSLGSIFGQGSEPSKTTRRRSAASVDDFVNQKTRRGE
jgi:ribosomal protein L37E